MKASQIVVVALIAVACALGVTAMYSIVTTRLDLASYCVLSLGGVAVALVYALQYNRVVEDACAAEMLARAQYLSQRNK